MAQSILDITEADYNDPAHQKAIVELINSYAHDPRGNAKTLSDEVCAALIPALRDHPATRVFLAFVDGAAVGIAVCLVGFSTFTARPVLNIHDLVVLPQCRGQGVGRSLLAHVEQHACQMNCGKVTLEVNESNHGARKLYREVGYGRTPDGAEKEPVFFLEKYLT
jgi:ribosomal protein S18 acetylase RimI-like enzyme